LLGNDRNVLQQCIEKVSQRLLTTAILRDVTAGGPAHAHRHFTGMSAAWHYIPEDSLFMSEHVLNTQQNITLTHLYKRRVH
jgi:hypothetical protein